MTAIAHTTDTLIGEVPWNHQRAAAQRAVATLFGVTGVENRIVLKPLIPVSPAEAHRNITAAFVRNANLDADEVVVNVQGNELSVDNRLAVKAPR